MTEQREPASERHGRSERAADPIRFLSGSQGQVPDQMALDDAVAAIADLHARTGGATFSLYWGDLTGQPLFAVSIYPERGAIVPGVVSSRMLESFITANRELLADPRNAASTWLNEDDGNTYLDISTVVVDEGAAAALGERYNQIAIFDLAAMQVIPPGGTGEPVPDLPPIEKRLPPLASDV